MKEINTEYSDWVTFITENKCEKYCVLSDNQYILVAKLGAISVVSRLSTSPSEILTEFETEIKPLCNQSPAHNVVTAMEQNDKVLQCVWAHAIADASGVAVVQIPVPGTPGQPNEGRYVAYGDAEFEVRHIFDRITKIEVVDIDNITGYGEGVVLKAYHETDLQQSSSFGGGMAMTFKYGNTEVQPVGGYGFIPAGLYLRIEATKGDGAQGAGTNFTVSVDWAKYEPE